MAAIEAGTARYAVVVFRDQRIDDDREVAFSRHFGPLEEATGDLRPLAERRLSMALNDISNLDQSGQVMARDDRRRLFGLGNMLWHSESSCKPAPARCSLLSARVIPFSGGDTEIADMRAADTALDDEAKAMVQDRVREHSQLHAQGALGFTDIAEEERRQCPPLRQRLVRRHPVSERKSLFRSAHIGAIDGMPVPEARMLIRDLTEHGRQREFVSVDVWRRFDPVMWDNPRDHAPRAPLRSDGGARQAPHHRVGRGPDARAGRLSTVAPG